MHLRFFHLILSAFISMILTSSVCLADATEGSVGGGAAAIEVVEAPEDSKGAIPAAKTHEGVEGKVQATLPKASVEVKKDSFAAGGTARVVPGMALQTAKGEKLAVAMGHYARSRALLISALREFDKGYELVDPSALLDSDGWRQGITMRAQELARVLDPQPRASQGGIRFDSSTAGTGDAGSLKKK